MAAADGPSQGEVGQVDWGKLTDNELTTIDGNADLLAGKIRERYGIAEEEARRQLDDFLAENAPRDADADA
jgi:uncharacterized protein YjbJ (UPF0337 family)